MQINDWVKIIFESLYDGVLIADDKNVVKYINASYSRITNVSYDEIVGLQLEIARPGSKLPEVIKTGEKLLGVRRKVGDAEYIVNMVPIIEDNVIVGGISLLNEINDVYKLAEKLEKSNKIIKNLEDRVQMGTAKYNFRDIIHNDEKSIKTIKLALKMADKDMNVLITGESGTGKELYAQSIHNASDRKHQPFVAINCATLDNNLLESELFGYQEGAFTGAKKGGKIGLFEKAHGGTIFLDEISEMDYRLQAKLLRTLQENVVRHVGGVTEIPIDVRVIAATNKVIENMIEDNAFRKDLYYRLAVFTLNLTPLRERREDILILTQNFLVEINKKSRIKVSISEEVMTLLYSYDWPGNVRELKNTIEYAAMMTDFEVISYDNLPKRIQEEGIKKNLISLKPLNEVIKEAEVNEIKKAILKYGDTVAGKKKVAEVLGISLASVYNKLK